jgi:5'-nucleotidase
VGGIARFQTLCNHYAKDDKFKGQSELLTLFSGDAFNPSLESSVTKGKSSGLSVYLWHQYKEHS